MSARMSAASGMEEYQARYDAHSAQLEETFLATRALYKSEELQRTITLAEEANNQLAGFQARAFNLGDAGKYKEATALLHSPAYHSHRMSFEQGVDAAANALEKCASDIRSRLEKLLFSFALIFFASLFVLYRVYFRIQRNQRMIEAERMHSQMAKCLVGSAMDVMNNFLNNMVYFQTKAMVSDDFDAAELAMLEKAMAETKEKFNELAEVHMKTHDLGGIVVSDTTTSAKAVSSGRLYISA